MKGSGHESTLLPKMYNTHQVTTRRTLRFFSAPFPIRNSFVERARFSAAQDCCRVQRVQLDDLFPLAVSRAQTARMAASSPEPFGTASLLLLAKYQRVSDEVAVRLPGIWRWAFVSVSRNQSQAYCNHL